MDSFAHALAGAAAAAAARRYTGLRIRVLPWALWAVFPDALGFGPGFVVGLWRRLPGGPDYASGAGGHFPHAHIGLPLYDMGHSLLAFAAVWAVCSLAARRPVTSLLGWLLHILIDIPTHSYSYHATQFLWPISDYGFDGIPWWTPWLWWSTYGCLAIAYALLWRRGWLISPPASTKDNGN